MSWDAVEEAESYNIEINGKVISGIKNIKYQLRDLTPNTEYVARIMAMNETNTSDWSTYITIHAIVNAPQNLKAVSTTNTTTVSWDTVVGAAGYDIEINGTVFDAGNQPSYTNTGLTPNTQYIYRVRAKNAGIVSEWSSQLIETTTPEMTISCASDDAFNFVIVAPKKAGVNKRVITVTYNADEVEVLDLCATTPGTDLTVGKIQGTDITVSQYAPGKIVLTIDNADKTTMNIIKFKAKSNINSKISYEIE